MGKATRWFRGLLGLKKTDSRSPTTASSDTKPPKEKRRWSFVKSYREKECSNTNCTRPPKNMDEISCGDAVVQSTEVVDPNKHAIAVAAATAAVAEAAVAAARAAASVVSLTSSGRCVGGAATHVSSSFGSREEWAAVKIQSAFRGCLARRALRALKGLVRLQALVRGHIDRKRTAEWLHRMQYTLLRAQARAFVAGSRISDSPCSSSKLSHIHTGPLTPEKSEHLVRSRSVTRDKSPMLKKNGSKSLGSVLCAQEKRGNSHDQYLWSAQRSSAKTTRMEDERSDKILEIDTGKPHSLAKRRNLFHSASVSDHCSYSFTASKDSTTHESGPSPSSCEVHSFSPLKLSHGIEESPFCTADNSPQFFSASSKGGGSSKRSPFAPTKSDGYRSYFSGYADHPNYMSYTESSKAKVRSLSAPKQRPQYERSISSKRYTIHGLADPKHTSQKISTLQANFTAKVYPGSGRLDRLGMPVWY